MDALQLLVAQHRDILELLDEVGRVRVARERRHLFERATDRIHVHMLLEEQFMYPAVADSPGPLTPARLLEGHMTLRMLITDLLRADDANLTFDIKLQVLREQLSEHMREEERRLFVQWRRYLSPRRLKQLGRQMVARQARLIVESAPRDQLQPVSDQLVLS